MNRTIHDLPTPCLVLDPAAMDRNVRALCRALARHPHVALRQHVKTAKSLEVASRVRAILREEGVAAGGITVSTLAEAEAFAAAGWTDILYAVGIVPQKIERLARLGAIAITDDASVVTELAARVPPGRAARIAVELDVGQHRGGVVPSSAALLDIAAAIRSAPALSLVGVVAHAGHAYDAASVEELAAIAESERAGAVLAAERLRAGGYGPLTVSVGSTPTALAAQDLAGVDEVRAGVFVFSDLFQAALSQRPPSDIAVSVLASVISVRDGQVLLDAGALALSKDRSMDGRGGGYGELRGALGQMLPGAPRVVSVNQEHGFVAWPSAHGVRIGDRVRVLPNHACMTAAQHPGYHVLDGERVVDFWPRIVGF